MVHSDLYSRNIFIIQGQIIKLKLINQQFAVMYDFGFKKSHILINGPLIPDPEPLQHLLSPQTPILQYKKNSSQFQDIIRAREIEISEKQQLIHEMNKKINYYQEQLIFSEKKNERLQIETKQLVNRLQYLKLEFSQAQAKYQQLLIMYNRQGLADLEKENKVLSMRLKKIQKDLIEKEKELIAKNKQFTEKNQESRKLLQKLNFNVQKKDEKMKQQMMELQKNLNAAIQVKIQAERNCSQLQQQLKSLKNRFSVQLQELSKQNLLLKSQSSNYLKSYEQQTQQIASLTKENSNLKQALRSSHDTINEYLIEKKRNEDNLKQAQSKLENLQQYFDRIQYQRNELQAKCQVIQADYSSTEQKINQLSLTIEQLSGEKQKLLTELKLQDNKYKQLQKTLQHERSLTKTNSLSTQNLQLQLQQYKMIQRQNTQRAVEYELKYSQIEKSLIMSNQQIGQKQQHIQMLQAKYEQLRKRHSKCDELLAVYRDQIGNSKRTMETKWNDLKQIYQEQIEVLQEKIYQNQKNLETKRSIVSTQRKVIRGALLMDHYENS